MSKKNKRRVKLWKSRIWSDADALAKVVREKHSDSEGANIINIALTRTLTIGMIEGSKVYTVLAENLTEEFNANQRLMKMDLAKLENRIAELEKVAKEKSKKKVKKKAKKK